jgi:hypothetical protein
VQRVTRPGERRCGEEGRAVYREGVTGNESGTSSRPVWLGARFCLAGRRSDGHGCGAGERIAPPCRLVARTVSSLSWDLKLHVRARLGTPFPAGISAETLGSQPMRKEPPGPLASVFGSPKARGNQVWYHLVSPVKKFRPRDTVQSAPARASLHATSRLRLKQSRARSRGIFSFVFPNAGRGYPSHTRTRITGRQRAGISPQGSGNPRVLRPVLPN